MITDYIRQTLEEVRDGIAANIAANGRTASGNTAASMDIEVYMASGRLTGRPAFWTLEKGRGPGRIPANLTEIIKQWALDKGISITPIPYVRQPSENWQPKYTPQERGLEAFAGAVVHNIANKGTKLYQEGGEDNIYTPVIEKAMEKLSNNVMLDISTQLWLK